MMATQVREQASARPAGWGLWGRWTLATAVGELAGFSVPAIAGAALASLGLPDLAMILVAALCGVAEGAILGFAQSLALRQAIPGLPPRHWVGATAVAAPIAWIMGMTLGTQWERLAALPLVILIAGAAVLGLTVLLSIGVAQWVVLRQHVRHAGWWVPANALAWALGLTACLAGMSLTAEGQPVALMAAIGIGSGLAMGLIVAALTGAALVWLLRSQEPQS